MSFISDFMDSLRRLFSGGGLETQTLEGGHRLYVGNLSYQVKEDELRGLFSKYGKVKALHLIRDRMTGRLKGYAFLEMSPEDSKKALALHGADFLGRKLVVSIAKAKRIHSQPNTSGPKRPNRWKKNRSGPRAYGDPNENTPLQRYE